MKNNSILRFTGVFTLYLIVLIAIASVPMYMYVDHALMPLVASNLVFFYVLTFLSFFMVGRSMQKSGSMINAFLGGIVMTLLVAMIYLFFVLKKFTGHEVDFVISFFASYLICTGFEVYYILYNLRQN